MTKRIGLLHERRDIAFPNRHMGQADIGQHRSLVGHAFITLDLTGTFFNADAASILIHALRL
jgi:hypothetical protein